MNEDKDKFQEYIDLCVPSFLIKMKNKYGKSYFFRAYPSTTPGDPAYKNGILRFTIADMDKVSDETTQYYREIDLNVFGKDFEKLKATIIPDHKDMYKDIDTGGMEVDCGKDNCGGNELNTLHPPAPETKRQIKKIKPPNLTQRQPPPPKGDPPPKWPPKNIPVNLEELAKQKEIREQRESAPITEQSSEGFGDANEQGGGRKKKKKRRKKSSRSKKRRNKRNNRTKKN